MQQVKSAGPPAADTSRVLELERVFPAPVETVYRAWTDPADLARWWGPKGMAGEVHEMDLRPGGRWMTSMRRPNGDVSQVGGLYEVIDPPRRLVFTWAWIRDGVPGHETRVTLSFDPEGEGTRLRLRQETFQDTDARDKHAEGWGSSFDCLEEMLAA